MALSKDSILKHAGTMARAEVHVPELVDENGDDVVLVRAITVKEWEIHQGRQARAKDNELGFANAYLLSRGVIDENGRPVFTEADVRQLAELAIGPVDKIASKILEVSGLKDSEESTAEDEARGESEPAQTSSSSSE